MLPERGIFLEKAHSGELRDLAHHLSEAITHCQLCPHRCGVDRTRQTGYCAQTDKARLTNAVVHTGEEPPLIEGAGAGAVFFSGCTMRCVYCQNFGFSQLNTGFDHHDDTLAEIFLSLQKKGVSNLDLVSPTPHLRAIVSALDIGARKGLTLPVVYNTSSYESVETLQWMDGVVDLYLADIRYTTEAYGMKYSGVKDYWSVARKAIREMFRQVGSRRLIIRLLVLPEGINGTREALRFVCEELSPKVHISLMSQYFPVYKALDLPPLNRKITAREYEEASALLDEFGFENGWLQDFS